MQLMCSFKSVGLHRYGIIVVGVNCLEYTNAHALRRRQQSMTQSRDTTRQQLGQQIVPHNNHQDKSHFQFFSIRCSLIIVICHSHFISSSILFILNKHLLVHSHDDGGMCDNLAVARSKQRRTNRFDRSEQTKSKPSKTSFIWLFTE